MKPSNWNSSGNPGGENLLWMQNYSILLSMNAPAPPYQLYIYLYTFTHSTMDSLNVSKLSFAHFAGLWYLYFKYGSYFATVFM